MIKYWFLMLSEESFFLQLHWYCAGRSRIKPRIILYPLCNISRKYSFVTQIAQWQHEKSFGFLRVSVQHLNICRIKMNVGLKQTAVDHSKGATPCTSSSPVSRCHIMLYHYFPWQWFSIPPSTPLTCAVFKGNLLSAPAIICHFWTVRYT